MKSPKTMIILFVVFAGLIGVALFYPKDPPASTPLTSGSTSPTAGEEQNTQQRTDSRYVNYSKESLEMASDKKRVLFFYASWCPTCRPVDADFMKNENKIPEDFIIIRVNYNDPETDQEEKDLAAKYGITYQHTYVQIDNQGNQVTKWNGGSLEELLGNIK